MALWTKTAHSDFHVDRTNGCLVVAMFMFFPSYSATKWPISTIYFIVTSAWALTQVCRVWERYLIPFRSYRHFTKSGPAPFKRFGVPLPRWVESSKLFFLDNYWYSLSRESFCTGLVRSGGKPKTSSQNYVLQKMQNTRKFRQAHDQIWGMRFVRQVPQYVVTSTNAS